MDRRHALMGLALAGAAGTTFASFPALAAMGKPEMEHAMKTAMAGHASLMEADLGLQKATDPKIKMFAQFEHDEQTTIAEILKAMSPKMDTPKPDAQAAATLDKLKSASGAEFDKAFVRAQIDGHKKLLAIQEDYLASGKDMATIAVTKLARGQIKEHLAILAELSKMS